MSVLRYTARNERLTVLKSDGTREVHMRGLGGEMIGVYRIDWENGNSMYTKPVRLPERERVYAAGRLVFEGGQFVATDRLGSAVYKFGTGLAVQNGGFESYQLTPWASYGSAQISISNVSRTGGHSMRLTTTVSDYGAYQDVKGLVAGMSYQFQTWVRAESGTNTAALAVCDPAGGGFAWTGVQTIGTNWQLLSVYFTATGKGIARIHLAKYDTTGALLWDDVELVNGVTATSGLKMRYYPYGQEVGTATANDVAKFGTYTRDAGSGLDYAMNRYYMSTWGRFTTADPYRASGGLGNPGSWNRYAYVQGDPVNWADPGGLQMQMPGCMYSGFSAPGGSIDTSTNCLPGYVEDWTYGGGGGGISLADTRTTPTFSIDVFRRLHNAAALAALLRNLSSSGGAAVPATLKLQNICWTEADPSAGSFAYTLRVTYRIFNGEGKPMTAASLAGITITEQFWEVSGNTNIQEHPGSWTIYKRDGINADGTFVDYLSAGGGLAGYSRSGSALQGFYAHGFLSNGIPLFHQSLVVHGFGPPTTVLSNTYTTNSVTVNGLGLGRDPSTRCQ